MSENKKNTYNFNYDRYDPFFKVQHDCVRALKEKIAKMEIDKKNDQIIIESLKEDNKRLK